jgi:TatD DNase family protein
MIVDTHAHIYYPELQSSIDDILLRAQKAGVAKILLPNVDLESYEAMMKLVQNQPQMCLPMLGLHPCSVQADYKYVLEQLYKELQNHRFCAIGEIGMDLHWDTQWKSEQIDALETQLSWSYSYQLPVALHTRKSTHEVIQILKKHKNKPLKGVFHCFSGSYEEAKQIIDLGFYLGIGGVITFKNAGLAEVLKKVPLESLVLETDAPYLAPVPHRGKTNEPSWLTFVVDRLAEVYQMAPYSVAYACSKNADRLFNLHLFQE